MISLNNSKFLLFVSTIYINIILSTCLSFQRVRKQNEEWIDYDEEGVDSFVGLSAHALDINTKTLYAVGAVTNTGFEKIVEIKTLCTRITLSSLRVDVSFIPFIFRYASSLQSLFSFSMILLNTTNLFTR